MYGTILQLLVASYITTGTVGVIGGFLFNKMEIKTLFVACFFLLIALLYDSIRLQYHLIKRKRLHSK
jgi:hypothetical protein